MSPIEISKGLIIWFRLVLLLQFPILKLKKKKKIKNTIKTRKTLLKNIIWTFKFTRDGLVLSFLHFSYGSSHDANVGKNKAKYDSTEFDLEISNISIDFAFSTYFWRICMPSNGK